MSDEERMLAVKSGDMAAFEDLVERWYERATRYAYALLSDADAAEEAAQDCFAALYIKRHQYDSSLAFENYFKALLRHKCIDMLRAKKRSPALPALEAEALSDESSENRLVNKLFQESLAGVILSMPEAQRDLLIAYAIEGKSYKELAKAFHLSVAQIKIRLHRIRKQLKQFKEEWQ